MEKDKPTILAEILNRYNTKNDFEGTDDLHLSYDIFLTLTPEERKTVGEKVEKEHMKKYVEKMMKRVERMENKNIFIKNEDIGELLRRYKDKKSKKVVESRRKIRARFDKQSYKDQVKIIDAFLDGARTDREWSYNIFRTLWDKKWESKIEELWNKYKEPKCSTIVLMHLSDEFVETNSRELNKVNNMAYSIRTKNIEALQYEDTSEGMNRYAVAVSKIGQKLDEKKAEWMLFHTIALELEQMKEDFDVMSGSPLRSEYDNYTGNIVKYALWVLGKIGNYDTIMEYRTWQNRSMERIHKLKIEEVADNLWALKEATEKQHLRDIVSAFMEEFPIKDGIIEGLRMDIRVENEKFEKAYKRPTRIEDFKIKKYNFVLDNSRRN